RAGPAGSTAAATTSATTSASRRVRGRGRVMLCRLVAPPRRHRTRPVERPPPPGGTRSELATQAHRPLRLALVLLAPQRLTLVPQLLAARGRDLDLRATADEVQLQRHDRAALLARDLGQLLDLLTVQQQLALAPRRVVRPGALGVLGDVHALEPGLAAVDRDPAVHERGAPGTQALHLGPGKRQPHLVGVVDVVVVPRLLVARHDVLDRARVGARGHLLLLGATLDVAHDCLSCRPTRRPDQGKRAARRRPNRYAEGVRRCRASG